MDLLSFLRTDTGLTEATVEPDTEVREMLRAEQETNLILQEALVDAQLAMEDRGWQRLTADAETESPAKA